MPDPLDQLTIPLRAELEAAIVQRAIADGSFWQALLTNANAALADYFQKDVPNGITVRAVAEDARTFYHVLPDPQSQNLRSLLTVGPSRINPREAFTTRTNYLLSIQQGDPNTSGESIDALRQGLTQAKETAAGTAATALTTAEQALRDARVMEAAWADWQQAQTTANIAQETANADPDNADLQSLASQAAEAAAEAETAYNNALQTATNSQIRADDADAADETADAAVDAAERALFQAGFAIDPVSATGEAFNTSLPFNDNASVVAASNAQSQLQRAQDAAALAASAADNASQQAVEAARAAAEDPDDASLQQAALDAANEAQAASDAAALAANEVASALTQLREALAVLQGTTLTILDEARDGVLYLVLPYAPHRCAFMGPYSLAFDGASSAVQTQASATIMPQTKMTVEAWIQSPGFDQARQDVIASQGNGTTGWSLSVPGGIPTFAIALEGNSPALVTVQPPGSPALLSAGDWHYLVAVYDGTQVLLYVDGSVVATVAASGSIIPFTGLFTLGDASGSNNADSCYAGMLHEVRLWGDALTPAQIASNKFHIQAPGDIIDAPVNGLLAHYEFVEGAGLRTADSSGCNHDLTLLGATWISTGLQSPS